MLKFRITREKIESKKIWQDSLNGIFIQFNRPVRGKWYRCISDFRCYTKKNAIFWFKMLWNLATTLTYIIALSYFTNWLIWEFKSPPMFVILAFLVIVRDLQFKGKS